MDGKYGSEAQGWGDIHDLRGMLTFEVTSCLMTQLEITRALNIPGATVRLDSERIIAEIPIDSAASLLSRMFTCRFTPAVS